MKLTVFVRDLMFKKKSNKNVGIKFGHKTCYQYGLLKLWIGKHQTIYCWNGLNDIPIETRLQYLFD